MAKHRTATQLSWGRRIGVALAAVLVVVGVVLGHQLITGDDPGDAPPEGANSAGATDEGTGPGDGPSGTADAVDLTTDAPGSQDDAGDAAEDPAGCGTVTVWAAPALAATVEAAAGRVGDDCFAFDVVTRESATAQSALRSGETPDVWLADSTAWPELLAASDVPAEAGAVIASSPVLLAGHQDLVAGLGELGVDADTTWADLVETYERVGGTSPDAQVQLRVGDPRVDPATMSLLSTVGSQLAAAEPGSPGSNLMVSLAQTAVRDDPLSAVDARTIVPATEQQIAAAGDADLRGVPLKDGIGVVHMPFVRIGDPELAQAVDALEEALTSEEAADDLAEASLRAGTDGPAPEVAGIPEGVTADGEQADPAVVAALAQRWTVIAPQSQILTLIDISGSMEQPVGDTTRVDLTRTAAQTALSVLPEQTAIGLWYFATELDGDKDWLEKVPLRALDAEVRSGVTQKDVLLEETTRLTADLLTADTGLHDSLWAAYQYMSQNAGADSISSIVLLTDGVNDDPSGGLEDDEVIELLTKARDEADHKVTVVLIGMGEEPDEEALEELAEAAGGQAVVLRDPRELPQVFVDVVARRAT